MTYFNSREIAIISLFSALWGILNGLFAPIVFRIIGLPILCDMIGFASLSLTFWWVRKFGAVTIVGLVATLVNFILNPGGIQFLGFTAASIVFDLASSSLGPKRMFRNTAVAINSLLLISIWSAAVAGLIIGSFFMATPALAAWGGVWGWAGIHGVGGITGGLIGIAVITTLVSRGIQCVQTGGNVHPPQLKAK
jgi:hypothetical protein